MKKIFRLMLCTVLFLAGCSSSRIGFLSTAIVHPIRPRTVELNDGFRADYYTFVLGNEDAVDTYLFFITGSGYASAQFCQHYLWHLPGNVRVFALQKRSVKHWTTGLFNAPEEFHETYFLSTLKKDHIGFVKQILSEKNIDGKRLVLFGVSEGSFIASAVAAEIPQITHLVSLGEGGMKGLDSFRIWGKENGIDFDDVYRQVSQKPSIGEPKKGTFSNRWWKEMLEADPMPHLKSLSIPVLFAMGEKDNMVPVESLYYLQSEFGELEKDNLTVEIYTDCNHQLVDSKGKSHRREFLKDVANWWNH